MTRRDGGQMSRILSLPSLTVPLNREGELGENMNRPKKCVHIKNSKPETSLNSHNLPDIS